MSPLPCQCLSTVGIEAGKHYKDIYQSIKDRLAAFNSAVGINILEER